VFDFEPAFGDLQPHDFVSSAGGGLHAAVRSGKPCRSAGAAAIVGPARQGTQRRIARLRQ
jgi:hypothetical protein